MEKSLNKCKLVLEIKRYDILSRYNTNQQNLLKLKIIEIMRNLVLILLTGLMIFISKSLYSQVLVSPGNVNYPTLGAAFAAINSSAYTYGPKTLTINGDIIETGSTPVYNNHCSSLTINTSGNFTVTTAFSKYIIAAYNIPTVNIDGRIGSTGTEISLKFNNIFEDNEAYLSGCIRIDGSINCNIKYVECKGALVNPATGQSVIRIDDDYSLGTPHTVIENCMVDGGLNSILYFGKNNLVIRNNKLRNFGERSMYLKCETITTNITAEDNEIYRDSPVNFRSLFEGIRVFSMGNCTLRRNVIRNMDNLSGTCCGIRIDMDFESTNLNIENNFISIVSPSTYSLIYGILLSDMGVDAVSVINNNFNTIYIGGTNPYTYSYCISEQLTGPGTVYNQFNNICINERTGGQAFGNNININPGVTINADYNCYWSNQYFTKWNLIYYVNLTEYKIAAFPNEQNSIFKSVYFLNKSTGDLHLSGTSASDYELIGNTGTGVTEDIDLDPRDPLYPIKGADESDLIGGTTSLALKCYQEGFYNSTTNQMVKSIPVSVNLKRAVFPFNTVSSSNTNLDVNGNMPALNFNIPYEGSYYIVVNNWNMLTTWNSTPLNFTVGGTTNYDFTPALNKAFGNNLLQIDASPLRWGIFGGDVNQDEVINNTDVTVIHNASAIYSIGNIVTDLNGDEIIDADDLVIVRNNEANSVHVVKP